jgi:hypothetical protein
VLDEYRNRLTDLAGLADRLEELFAKRGPTLPGFAVARLMVYVDRACNKLSRLATALELEEETE